jgi:hypothetical protein
MRKVLLGGAVCLLGTLSLSAGVATAALPPPTLNAGCVPGTISVLGPPGLGVVSSGQRGLELVQPGAGIIAGVIGLATTQPHTDCPV